MIAQGKKHKRWTAANQAELAAFFRCSVDTIANWRKKGMPGAPGRYDLAEIVAWWKSDGPGRTRGADFSNGSLDDLIEAGGDSPNLERCRLARAQLYEFELETKRKSILPRDMARNALGRVMSLLRQYAERLGKRHGPEEVLSFRETLNECRQVIDDEFGSDDLQAECPPGGDVAPGRGVAADRAPDKRVGRKRAGPPQRPVQRRTV